MTHNDLKSLFLGYCRKDSGTPDKQLIGMEYENFVFIPDEDNPEGDIEIEFTGLRPGEKLYEELLVGQNSYKTENKLIMRAKEEMMEWKNLKPILNELNDASLNADYNKVSKILSEIVPGFTPKSYTRD